MRISVSQHVYINHLLQIQELGLGWFRHFRRPSPATGSRQECGGFATWGALSSPQRRRQHVSELHVIAGFGGGHVAGWKRMEEGT